jgi:2-polyprenyl-6-methoxyphenol hydroxylase-like FAD-dependent oxidoreductase
MVVKHDVIVVGARCAGSPTAMLLARRGYKVLLVDRASFPSDTISTHVVQPLGVAALERWGLLERLTATGCPAVGEYSYDFGDLVISGTPGTAESPVAYSPRRTVLDKLLVDAAAEAGVQVRENFTVEELLFDDDSVTGIRGHTGEGNVIVDRASVVIGADGRSSIVAKAVGAQEYNTRPPLLAAYYGYWSGLPMHGRFETCIRPYRGFAAAQTHDGLTLVISGWPFAQHSKYKGDIEASYLATMAISPEFADRLGCAKLESRLLGTAVPNYFRKPYGPGWALVGDAGYNKDFVTAQGIADAFHQAELLVEALDRHFSGHAGFDDGMSGYQQARDVEAMPMYEFTCELATMEPPSEQMRQLLAALAGNQAAMDDFARVNAGTISPASFFAPENVTAIMQAANRTA